MYEANFGVCEFFFVLSDLDLFLLYPVNFGIEPINGPLFVNKFDQLHQNVESAQLFVSFVSLIIMSILTQMVNNKIFWSFWYCRVYRPLDQMQRYCLLDIISSNFARP